MLKMLVFMMLFNFTLIITIGYSQGYNPVETIGFMDKFSMYTLYRTFEWVEYTFELIKCVNC